MINRFWLWLLPVALLALSPSPGWPDSIIGNYKTITLDGSLSDWTSGDLMYPDGQIADGTPDNSSYENIFICNDATYLYIGLDIKGSGGGPITNTYTRNLYIDSDMDPNTGFDGGWMSGGYDRLVQYGQGGGSYSIHSFTGAGQGDWSWSYIELIDYSYSEDIAELGVGLAALGLGTGNQARLEFHVTGSGVSVETWAHSSESSVGTYTFAAIPEPASALLLAAGLFGLRTLRRRMA